MTALLEQIKIHFESFSSREQWLIALAGWLGIVWFGFTVFIFPQKEVLINTSFQVMESNKALQELVMLNVKKEQKLNSSPDIELEEELDQLIIDANEIDFILGNKVAGLVSASEMPSLMENVLKTSGRLTLLSMISQPSVQLATTEDKRYYIHPVALTLKGTYFDIVNYLASLEALPIKYYWRSVDYRVLTYPTAEVKINVYTLGESAVFIGGTREIKE